MESWTLHGREFANCNCAYGCPCQFNALPTHGNCRAVVGIQVDKGNHGSVKLDGLRMAGNPIKLSGFDEAATRNPAPGLDADGERVRREFAKRNKTHEK